LNLNAQLLKRTKKTKVKDNLNLVKWELRS
jgi:hypothetical protein